MVEFIQSMTLTTTLIIIGVIWLCAFICWIMIHTPSVNKGNSGRSDNDPVSIWNKHKRGK
jgi:hypothetical protein